MSSQETDIDETLDNDAPAAAEKLDLQVKIDSPGTCQRHITVTVSEKDVERYFGSAIGEMMPKAVVPGFRAGRAPRKLVETRFRKEVAEQVKGSILMDSMSQVTDDNKLSAISEPDIDVGAIEVPLSGPMTFEFNLEVRPEFDMPQWKGLKIERPSKEFSTEDVDRHLQRMLEQNGRLVPFDGAASAGDFVTANLTCKEGDEVLSTIEEAVIRIRPTLSFRDGKLEGFGKLMTGVKGGESRQAEIAISEDAANESLRGKKVTVVFEVLEVKKLEIPAMSPEQLQALGGFENEGELRDVVMNGLKRQLAYRQQQQARQQVTAMLTASANWDLPPDLLRRQSVRELERSVMELRRSGFGEDEILAHQNELRQNVLSNTARSLTEHFILERIAEDEKIEDLPEDYETEIKLIASQSGESVRRVRAQLEKRDLMDILRNQIIERKTVDLILAEANFKEVPFETDETDIEAIDESIGGGDESDIPEAQSTVAESLPTQTERH
ncbi:MAG: trigger factor [Planctomycetota bacterium]|nr:trigger factor [Planctomycetota bacterium]